MNRGYIKFYRRAEDSRAWSRGIEFRGLLITLLEKANYKEGFFLGGTISRGQIGTTMQSLADELGINRNKLLRMLCSLSEDGFCSVENVNNRYSVITITNYELYQSPETTTRTTDEQPMNNRRTTDEQPLYMEGARDNEIKEVKKERREEVRDISASASPDADQSPEKSSYLTKRKRKLTGKRLEAFNRFWTAFAYSRGKAEAADAWLDIPQLTDSLVEQIVAAAEREAAARPGIVASGHSPKWAQGWISGRRWEDDATPQAPEKNLDDYLREKGLMQ